jgi:hypothetical protein
MSKVQFLSNFGGALVGGQGVWLLYGGVTTTEEITQQNVYAGHPFNRQGEARNNNVTVELLTTVERDAATNGDFSNSMASLPAERATCSRVQATSRPWMLRLVIRRAPFGTSSYTRVVLFTLMALWGTTSGRALMRTASRSATPSALVWCGSPLWSRCW